MKAHGEGRAYAGHDTELFVNEIAVFFFVFFVCINELGHPPQHQNYRAIHLSMRGTLWSVD